MEERGSDAARELHISGSEKNSAVSDTVYITTSGKSYHLPGCSGLQFSRIPVLLKEARASHRPCPNCGAPR